MWARLLVMCVAACGRVGFESRVGTGDGGVLPPRPEPPPTNAVVGQCNVPLRLDTWQDPTSARTSFAAQYEGIVVGNPSGVLRAYSFGIDAVASTIVADRPVHTLVSSIDGSSTLVIDPGFVTSVVDPDLVGFGLSIDLRSDAGLGLAFLTSDLEARAGVGTLDGGFVVGGATNSSDPSEWMRVAIFSDGALRGGDTSPGVSRPTLALDLTGSGAVASTVYTSSTTCSFQRVTSTGELGASGSYGDTCARSLLEGRDDHYVRIKVDAGMASFDRRAGDLAALGPVTILGPADEIDLATVAGDTWVARRSATTLSIARIDSDGNLVPGVVIDIGTGSGLRVLRIGAHAYAAYVRSTVETEIFVMRLCA